MKYRLSLWEATNYRHLDPNGTLRIVRDEGSWTVGGIWLTCFTADERLNEGSYYTFVLGKKSNYD